MAYLTYVHSGAAMLGTLFTVLAAVFWFKAARIKTPASFNITVQVGPNDGFGGGGGGGGIGAGYSLELCELANALKLQSDWNSWAAWCAFIAALCGGVVFVLSVGTGRL